MPSSMMLTETGITTEDVDAFVQGPDDSGKYVCLYDGCTMKAFGRKENIRAHVQTHLGDRKYVCGICANRFVRPNDLKRHSLIHQDDKDCICNCGAKFGRPDALRRHRTRKLECAAGDPTILALMKEEKKRGRPKKKAPVESAERRERKEKTRRKVMEKKRANSVATSTASSYPSPQHESSPLPQEWMPAGDMSFTPPASPEDSSQNIFSPYEFQPSPFVKGTSLSPPPTRGSMTAPDAKEIMVLASISPAEIDPFGPCDESLPPNSPLKSSLSEYGTPPELDLSSSPTSRLLDFGSTDSDLSSQATSTDKLMISSPPNDFDEFFAVDKFTSGRIVDLNDPFGDSMDWNQYNFR